MTGKFVLAVNQAGIKILSLWVLPDMVGWLSLYPGG